MFIRWVGVNECMSMSGEPLAPIHDVEPVNRRDKQQPLYTARKKIHPKRAEGTFRRFKWFVMAITLGIYYVTPWLRWDRGDYAPDQAVLIDLANRRFYFFFIEIWPQEFYYVAGMLVMAGIGLFLVTSSVGRAWCGYTCPQTVWVDLFLVVERAVEGDRNKRIKLDKDPLSASKLLKRVTKHSVWLLIAVSTGGAWIFYFADAPTLAMAFLAGDAPQVAYMTVGILTATTYVLGGLMREQVCTYMCPWPRIQGAMLDEHSLTVTYNNWRGEPRSRHQKRSAEEGKSIGDCVDCNACVAVCPMGIDIRDGQQLECITCALCIDACNSVMDKVGRERGLISYATLADYNHNMRMAMPDGYNAIQPERVRKPDGRLSDSVKHTNIRSILRPRTIAYFVVWAMIGLAMSYHVANRGRLDLNVLHDRNPLFVTLANGDIRNGYTLKVLNMMPEPRTVRVTLSGLPGAEMSLPGTSGHTVDVFYIDVEPDMLKSQRVYIRVKPELLTDPVIGFDFIAQDIFGSERATYAARFEAGDR